MTEQKVWNTEIKSWVETNLPEIKFKPFDGNKKEKYI